MGTVEELTLPKEIPTDELSLYLKEWKIAGVLFYKAKHTVVLLHRMDPMMKHYCYYVYRWNSVAWVGEIGKQNRDGNTPRFICDATTCRYGRSVGEHCYELDHGRA